MSEQKCFLPSGHHRSHTVTAAFLSTGLAHVGWVLLGWSQEHRERRNRAEEPSLQGDYWEQPVAGAGAAVLPRPSVALGMPHP